MTKEEWDRMFLTLMPVVTGAASITLGTLALTRASPLGRRIVYQDGQYLVSVRYPRQLQNLQDFVQPDNPDVLAIYYQFGPDSWALYDFVCRNIDYRRDIGEMWQFPSETLRGAGDCEDTSFLLCSLLRCFSDAHVVLGSFQGYGHAWCDHMGQIMETTYTRAMPVSDPNNYCPHCLFNEREVIELWPGALGEVFDLQRDEGLKLSLMAEAVECMSL
ncbi:hypothetical protein ES703_44222 [subsurface metagenome]